MSNIYDEPMPWATFFASGGIAFGGGTLRWTSVDTSPRAVSLGNVLSTISVDPIGSLQLTGSITARLAPAALASSMAATALSKTPSWQTDSSCRCRLPSR